MNIPVPTTKDFVAASAKHGRNDLEAIAAEIEGDEYRPSSDLLHQLSEQFEMCAYGLREVRREWESGSDNDGPLLIS